MGRVLEALAECPICVRTQGSPHSELRFPSPVFNTPCLKCEVLLLSPFAHSDSSHGNPSVHSLHLRFHRLKVRPFRVVVSTFICPISFATNIKANKLRQWTWTKQLHGILAGRLSYRLTLYISLNTALILFHWFHFH